MSFFDKLKGGVDAPTETGNRQKSSKEKKEKKIKKPRAEKPMPKPEPKKPEKPEKKPEKPVVPEEDSQSEGQLAIDVYETNGDFVIQSTIAGIKAEDLDISIENDLVTIRGARQSSTEVEGKKYLYQECYWGSFSRQIILPEEVDSARAQAKIKDGILTLKIPKVHKIKKRKVMVRKEE